MDFNPLMQDTTSSRTTTTLVLLAEIGEAINANLSLDTVLNRIVTALARLIPCDAITIALIDGDQDSFQLFAAVDGQGIPLDQRIGQHVAVAEFPTVRTILQTRTWLYIPDIDQSTLWRKTSTSTGRIRAFLGAPLIMEEKVIGLLFIDFDSIDPLTDELRYVLLAFIRYAAAAIFNAQQREKVTRSEERYRLAASLTSDAIYEWVIGDTRVDWSGDIDSLLRYETGQFPRTVEAWLDVIHPNDKKRVQIAREATVRDGNPFEEEYRMRRSDGTYCYVLDRAARFDSAPTARILGAISDLTNTYELTDALVESEVRYRTLFARSLDAIFVTDAHGLLLDFNPAAEALTGRDYGQLVSSSFQQLVPHSNLPDYYNALKWLAERGEVSNFEIRLSRPNNSVVEVEMWGAALGGGMYQFVARDVSVRKQNQIMAAQRVAELTALSDVTRTTTAGGDVIDMLNRALPVAMGALEMPLGCIYLYEAATESLRRVVEIGPTLMPDILTMSAVGNGRLTPFSPQVRIVEPPDSRVLLQTALMSNDNVMGLIVFSDTGPRTFLSTDIYLMDIIGRQLGMGVDNVRLLDNLEQLVEERTVALFTTETRYKSLIEQVPGVVYTAKSVYSGLSFISSGTEALFGLAPSEFIDAVHDLLNRIHADDLTWVREAASRADANGSDFDAQYRVLNAQTHMTSWVHHRARLIVAGNGETFWLGLLTDVTRLKELDDLKSQFVATVSHELRTPLSAIKLRAATLSNYYPRLTDDQRLEMVQRISYQADILADLIEDVLRLAKLDGGNVDRQVEEVNITAVAVDVIDELRPTLEAGGLDLEVIWDKTKSTVFADITDITRIWRNLISNAIKYTTAPGHVKVYTGLARVVVNAKQVDVVSTTVPEVDLIVPEEIEAGAWIVGVVTDTGKGISTHDQAHIFTRFFRGEAAWTSIPGTGLGLSLVKELLADYGGHVALRSTPGVGSTFAFWLPASKRTED